MHPADANYGLRCPWLASGGYVTTDTIDDFPELTKADIMACLEFSADRDHRLVASVSAA